MPLCLFEDDRAGHLAPMTSTRAAFDLRVGARTLLEAAIAAFPSDDVVLHTRAALAGVTAEEHPGLDVRPELDEGTLFVNGRWLVRLGDVTEAAEAARRSGHARAFVQDDVLLALWHPNPSPDLLDRDAVTLAQAEGIAQERVEGETVITHLWDLLADLGDRITYDAQALGGLGEHAGTVEDGAILIQPDRIHLGAGATIRAGAVVRADDGPVWIGPEAEIGENAVVKGPVYLGPKAVINSSARVDESAIGYWSKVGGEVHASIVHSLSSKGHDGYLGNSYLGRWCNLGADTNTSNLKNDYGQVTMWDAETGTFAPTGRQFAGLVMGDHSKCSINTMFNTGTVVGVFCNLFGADFPPRHVPDFSWGGADRMRPYLTRKAFQVARAVMARRSRELSNAERMLLQQIAEAAAVD